MDLWSAVWGLPAPVGSASPYIWIRAELGVLERILLHQGQTKEQSHLSSYRIYRNVTNRVSAPIG
jgi:hypothetical protein